MQSIRMWTVLTDVPRSVRLSVSGGHIDEPYKMARLGCGLGCAQ